MMIDNNIRRFVSDSGTRKSSPTNSSRCSGHQSLDSQQQEVSSYLLPRNVAKKVKFNTVEIREYNRQVGDHPSCSNGPPIR